MRARRARAIRTWAVILLLAAAGGAGAQQLRLEPLTAGPSRPTGIHSANDGSGRLFLLSKQGIISIFDGATELAVPFLDLQAQVNSEGSERGLHGLAFDPDYPSNGLFYVMYTNLDGNNVLSRWSVSGDPNVADAASEEVLWTVQQPQGWHNCSQLQFGPDGFLYIGCGDGGFVGDPDNRAQDLADPLGKIHRIDVRGAFPYEVPEDNPFVDEPGALPEIWAYGVRNPWRFSFDRETGDLFMGDVGQTTWEEVNFQPADSPGGENYGWRLMEGNHCYDPPTGCEDPELVLPIFEHRHSFPGECSVTGGFVYRGTRFPRFQGVYFYSDYCSGRFWAGVRLDEAWRNPEVLDTSLFVTTFGEDEDGELYVAGDSGGGVFRLVDPVPFCDVGMTAATYGAGDTVTAESARLVNLGETAVQSRLRVGLYPPEGDPILLLDLGEGGGFPVPPGLEVDLGPRPLWTVEPSTPRGVYRLVCRLEATASGEVLFQDEAEFSVN